MSTTMLNVYDLNRKKTAVLQNAFSITETQELNKIYSLSFSIPSTDEKVKFIQPFHYVRWGEDGELYRIIQSSLDEGDTGKLTVSCEHVIATLCDDLMFGAVQYGGGTVRTAAVISFLLGKQKTGNWRLAECDFDRRFEYLWEEENILNALYAIPREFSKAYKWVFDTASYPWKLSLKAIDETADPQYYMRAKRNLLSSGTTQDFTVICTRIYPLGYGEGVNQLTIREVNNGIEYLQSPDNIVSLYGIKEKVLVDRRFENPESLKEYAQTMLENLQTPSMSRSFNAVDLYPFTGADIDNAKVGNICRMTVDGTTAYITKTVRVLDEPGSLQIELSTKATDVASTVADLADRVRIESVYAQGATQLYQHSKDANATSQKGMIMSLYFPSEMRQINKVLLRLKLGQFRSYSQTTSSNGGFSQEYKVSEKSQTYSVEAKEQTYSVAESSKDYSVAAKEQNVTASYNKTATTDMTADSGQNLTTTKGGGGTGTTGKNTGKGNMNISITGSATNTDDANWTSKSDLYVLDASELDVHMDDAGEHSHDLWAYTGEVTPPASLDYKHSHAINYSGGALSNGKHKHSNAYADSHGHTIRKYTLRHNHPVSISISSNVQGQSGFEHTHNFSLGDHSHTINIAHQHKYDLSHSHKITIPGHSHTIKIPGHSHKITIPGHSHTITIPGHSHTVTIPAHSHDIAAGIYESGQPTAFDIYVSGTKKTTVRDTSYEGDITSWLLNESNQIPRDSWIDVEIRPNDLAYVQSSVFIQGFVQSRGGGNY